MSNNASVIPIVFSAGYGGAILGYDRNLAEGLPVKDAQFVVEGKEARFRPDTPTMIVNGGFEEYTGHRAGGCRVQDAPGKESFIDTQVFKEGQASLRFENFGQFLHGHGESDVRGGGPAESPCRSLIKTEPPACQPAPNPGAGRRALARAGSGSGTRPANGVRWSSAGMDFEKANLCRNLGGKQEILARRVAYRRGRPAQRAAASGNAVAVRDAASATVYHRRTGPRRRPKAQFPLRSPRLIVSPGSRAREGDCVS